jgi:glycosyltransferase involved in cell wall biosynthesis
LEHPLNVCTISEVYAHHAAHSGYVQLETYLGDLARVRAMQNSAASRLVESSPLGLRENLARRSGMQTYGVQHLPMEASVIQAWLACPGHIFHFLYGENGYRYVGNLKRLPGLSQRNFLVATYHLPPSLLERILVARNHIKRLDRIIVVGSSQLPFFRELVHPDKVVCIPHGIDVEYFTPAEKLGASGPIVTCLCVGHLLRDFETLLAVAWILKLERAPVKIIIVDAQFDKSHFASLDNVEVRRGVPDEELRRLYQTSDVCLLPLIDCTANNALLEAMASGLPIVTSQVGSVLDYVDTSCALLTPYADPRAVADAVMKLANTPMLRERMGQAARRRAEQFAWPLVARQVADLYQSLDRSLTSS